VRLNCLLTKQAVEEFAAQNGGVYPENVDSDRILDGKTVVDLLPRAHALANPYTGVEGSPVNHSATLPGEIGYALVHEYRPHDGRYIPPGYVITGFVNDIRQVVVTNLKINAVEALVMSHCRTVELALVQFAARNSGVYPSDVDACSTLDGTRIVDLLPGGSYLLNPTTWCATEPVNACAANQGEIGFNPICQSGINVGYVITGVGTECGTTIMCIVGPPPLTSGR